MKEGGQPSRPRGPGSPPISNGGPPLDDQAERPEIPRALALLGWLRGGGALAAFYQVALKPSPLNAGEDDIVAAANGTVQWNENPGQRRHIFRDAPGHYAEDTAANRAAISSAVTIDNFVRFQNGNAVFARQNSNGTENWVFTRRGVIQNGGINSTPRWTR